MQGNNMRNVEHVDVKELEQTAVLKCEWQYCTLLYIDGWFLYLGI